MDNHLFHLVIDGMPANHKCSTLQRRSRQDMVDQARECRADSPMRTIEVISSEGEVVFKLDPPCVGMPVTLCLLNDRYAGKITGVERNGRTIYFAHDEFVKSDDDYRGHPFTLRNNGRYVLSGADKHAAYSLSLGHANTYQAPEI